MKKCVKYLGYIAISFLALVIGIYLGSLYQQYKLDKLNGNLYDTTKVAVVNLDEGIKNNDNQINYANELLSNYTQEYVITGLDDAKRGIEDGRYSAYVIVPSNFSQNIDSINTTPKKSVFKYEISGNLLPEATDKAWQNVMMLREYMNDDVSYLYISSILGEFHRGQDSAKQILANDSKDKEVLMAISDVDLITTLDLRELERVKNDIEELEVEPDFKKNQEIMGMIDVAYKEYLNEGMIDLDKLKVESDNIHKDIDNIKTASSEVEKTFDSEGNPNYTLENSENNFDKKKNETLSDISNVSNEISVFDNDAQEYNNSFKGNINKFISEIKTPLLSAQDADIQIIDKGYYDNLLYDKNIENNYFKLETYESTNNLLNSSIDAYFEERENFINNINARDYILRAIVKDIIIYDDTPNTGLKVRQFIINNHASDSQMQQALYTYAISIGLSHEDALNFDLGRFFDFIMEREPLFNYPGIDKDTQRQNIINEFSNVLQTDLNNKINLSTNNRQLNFLSDEIDGQTDLLKSEINKLQTLDTSKISDQVNNLNTNVNNIAFYNFENTIKNDLSILDDRQQKEKLKLDENIDTHTKFSTEHQTKFKLYNTLDYIDNEEIEGYVNDYVVNNKKIQNKVEDKNQEYVQFADKTHQNASEQLSLIKEDVLKYQQDTNEKITSGLENAKYIKNITSEENSRMMNDYISKLPYTRNGTVEDTKVYEFISSPSSMEGTKAQNTMITDTFNYPLLFIILAIIILIIWLILHFIYKNKKREDVDKNKQIRNINYYN